MKIIRYILGLRRLPFVRDIVILQAGSSIFMVTGLLASIVYTHMLGKDQFGIYAIALSFTSSVIGLFYIGQGQSLYVFLAEAKAKNNVKAMAVVIRNYVNVGIVFCLFLLIMAVVMPSLSERIYGSPDIGKLARIICIFHMCDMWNSMTLIILQSLRQIKRKVFLEQSANFLMLMSGMMLVVAGVGVKGIFIGQLITSMVLLIVSAVVLKRLRQTSDLPSLTDILSVPISDTWEYCKQGLAINIDKAIGNYVQPSLLFALSIIAPPSVIGAAKIALQFAGLPRSFILPQAGDMATVVFAKEKARGMEIRRGVVRLIKHAVTLQVLTTAGTIVVLPFVIRLLYGMDYNEVIPMTFVMLIISILPTFGIANAPILRLQRKMPYSMIANGSSILLGLLLLFTIGRMLPSNQAFVVAFCGTQLPPVFLAVYVYSFLSNNHA